MKLFEDTIKERFDSFIAIANNFRSELILIAFSVVLIIASISIFIRADQKKVEKSAIEIESQDERVLGQETAKKTIFVDISGAVQKPDVYELPENSRLRDGLVAAGGLSEDANRDYFALNYNLARLLQDGEKIYVPKMGDKTIASGANQASGGVIPGQTSQVSTSGNQININTASTSELDKLPGVGPVTADKIIDGRPYASIDELLTKKAVTKSVFEKIKNSIVAP
jgi:competence protein ComEA